MEPIVGWALAMMLTAAPPGAWRGEAPEDTLARYNEIAAAAVAVAYDPNVAPVFAGKDGRARTTALLLSVAFHESGYRRDVDFGIGPNARGDSGQSWCLMQIRVGQGRTIEGWTGRDLVGDRKLCFASGLAAIRRSFVACRKNPTGELLNAYTSGSCDRGAPQSRQRIASAFQWLARHPIPRDDDGATTGMLQRESAIPSRRD